MTSVLLGLLAITWPGILLLGLAALAEKVPAIGALLDRVL